MNATCRVAAGAAAALAVWAVGCGRYTVRFEVADVINAWGEDLTRSQLDVDIVCVTSDVAEKLPELADGRLRSDEWFRLRDTNDAKLAPIPASRIYALRRGRSSEYDTWCGDSLLSARDRQDGGNTSEVRIRHPQPGNRHAAIVIYGRFNAQTGLAKTAPVVIQPPPGWLDDDEILIKVGRTSLRRAD